MTNGPSPDRGGLVPPSPVAALPLRSGVVFPGTTLTFTVGRARSLALVRTLHPGDVVATFTQKDPRVLDVTDDDVHTAGTLARVRAVQRRTDRELEIALEGLGRASIVRFVESDPFHKAEVTLVEDAGGDDLETRELARALANAMTDARDDTGALAAMAESTLGPGPFSDQVAAALELPQTQQVELLAEPDVKQRLRMLVKFLAEAKSKAEVRSKIESEVKKELGKSQREHVLREQMRAIRKELGEGEGDDFAALEKRLDDAHLPEEARKVADRELGRLRASGGQGAESNVIRSYLELIADLPWDKRAETRLDLDEIQARLDADHFGMADVKKRILEHVAVLKLAASTKGTLLCFYGPPGVGKTSLAESIAEATGRPFVRVALGGVRDEAEIRGHRRTYVGALAGRIVHALRKAKAKNPVVLLDEVDKMGHGFGGSPEAALLEVLDPEQNKTFTDHYLELPFDLSEVMFVCTANTLDTLSPPLRDRLEIVELTGYTPDEKTQIARRHLLPKRTKEHGIGDGKLVVEDAALTAIVRSYTREAGVRQLDRELTKLCRRAALDVARRKKAEAAPVVVREEDVKEHLGKPRFEDEVAERTAIAGVATGLAWTPVGGSILFIETSRMPGSGRVEITGQLGDVMKESARAALTYVRSNAERLGIQPEVVAAQDVHIHVPAGAVPKDGPSAGVTIFSALVSLFTGRRVREATAMTGECTLRGRVLPVGGIKAKVLAAHRAGMKRVILPRKCGRDLDEVPAEVLSELEVILVDDMSEVLAAALESEAKDPPVVFRTGPTTTATTAAI